MRARHLRGPYPRIAVLRIGHRPGRDPRLTTHVALSARALGAERLYLHPPDPAITERLRAVGRRWGGGFEVVGVSDWRALVRGYSGNVVHLSMYGLPIDRRIARLRRRSRLLLVVGGAKVPGELYRLADSNVAVGSQPQSEVGALAIALAWLRPLPGPRDFPNALQRIQPRARGKRVSRRGAVRP